MQLGFGDAYLCGMNDFLCPGSRSMSHAKPMVRKEQASDGKAL